MGREAGSWEPGGRGGANAGETPGRRSKSEMSRQTWHSRALKSQRRMGPWQRKQEEEAGGGRCQKDRGGVGAGGSKGERSDSPGQRSLKCCWEF